MMFGRNARQQQPSLRQELREAEAGEPATQDQDSHQAESDQERQEAPEGPRANQGDEQDDI